MCCAFDFVVIFHLFLHSFAVSNRFYYTMEFPACIKLAVFIIAEASYLPPVEPGVYFHV